MAPQPYDLVDRFIETWLAFDLQLREKQGLNEELLSVQIDLLVQMKQALEREPVIPKKLAEVFLDMWGAMTSSAAMYDAGTQQQITMAADHLTSHAREVCSG